MGDVNRHVQLRLAEIEQAQANSAQIASIAFRAAVFEESRRAARMNGGEPETVRQVTPEAVGAFHRDHFGPAGTTLIMAGDFVDDPSGGPPRRYYRRTAFGRAVARAESERLRALLDVAIAQKILGGARK